MPEFERIGTLIRDFGLAIAGIMLLLIGAKAAWDSRSGRGSTIGDSLGTWFVGVLILLFGSAIFGFIISRMGG